MRNVIQNFSTNFDAGGYLEKKQSFGEYKNGKKQREYFVVWLNNEYNNEKQHLRKQKSPDYQNGTKVNTIKKWYMISSARYSFPFSDIRTCENRTIALCFRIPSVIIVTEMSSIHLHNAIINTCLCTFKHNTFRPQRPLAGNNTTNN